MKNVLTVMQKEAALVLHSRQLILSAVMITIVFSATAAPAVLETGDSRFEAMMIMILTVIGVFMGYIFSAEVFLREKKEGTIETLLCTPLSLREIWAGKVAGIALPAWLFTLAAAGIMSGGASALAGAPVLPSGPVVLHALVAVPALTAVAVGLLGFVQLLLGMRENQIINMAVIFCVIFSFSLIAGLTESGLAVTWETEGVVIAASALLLLLVGWATRYLDRERIVTTIP
ncbi:ABC transporter permease subunit [Methanofollis fontis]|uniref:ABC transporter permease n=1 Tax=Methanofollis fontis TaxID=2052832 RepID=A0A483CRD4_9EURY|nr:ABC transporter permease subunit [Methanofollis fontis]TAJ45673.1 hypothetical protein CUJ86_02860 [Methanofollis fontis]